MLDNGCGSRRLYAEMRQHQRAKIVSCTRSLDPFEFLICYPNCGHDTVTMYLYLQLASSLTKTYMTCDYLGKPR